MLTKPPSEPRLMDRVPSPAAATGDMLALAALMLAIWLPGAHAASAPGGLSGEALYRKAGCIACHQAGGTGSNIAPMLPGHTTEQVKHYVRRPTGKMPRFGYDKLSDAELDAVAAYIAALPLPEMMPEAGEPQDALEMHHWMAYRSLSDGDPGHAEHHLLHAIEAARDASHRQDLERALGLARLKKTEAAAQQVLEIASARAAPDLTVPQIHLRLALGAIEAGDLPEAEHHVRHYMDGASAHDRRHAQGVLTVLRKGDAGNARKKLVHIMAK